MLICWFLQILNNLKLNFNIIYIYNLFNKIVCIENVIFWVYCNYWHILICEQTSLNNNCLMPNDTYENIQTIFIDLL